MVFCATCNEHLVRNTKKQVSTMGSCCQLLLPPHPAASHYPMLPPLLPLLDQRQ